MSEQNIINPTQTDAKNPSYGLIEALQQVTSEFMADSGDLSTRLAAGRGRLYQMSWNKVPFATWRLLRQWENQYRGGFFSFADWDLGPRYFSGRFQAPLRYQRDGNESMTVSGIFEELVGKSMFAYPSNWASDAILLEERDDDGNDRVKLTGSWAFAANANASGGSEYSSPNTGDFAEWLYFGYGCRVRARKDANLGIIAVTVTRFSDATVIVGPTNVDLYAAAPAAAAPVFTEQNLPLDFYRVKVAVTGAKNGASSGFTGIADCVEVMQ